MTSERCQFTCPHGDQCALEKGHGGGHNHRGCDCNEPDCPGEGRCHGSMSWCDVCGDVSEVCDDHACDRHESQARAETQRQLIDHYAESAKTGRYDGD